VHHADIVNIDLCGLNSLSESSSLNAENELLRQHTEQSSDDHHVEVISIGDKDETPIEKVVMENSDEELNIKEQ